jgi:hypothetical protein
MLSVFRVFRVLQVFRVPLGGTYTPSPADCPMAWDGSCLQWESDKLTWS